MGSLPAVDVILPVHSGCETFDACLQALETYGGYAQLIVIDDCSSDRRIEALLQRRAPEKATRVRLLRNDRALGFATCVNRGIASSNNDILVLAPDVMVTRSWVEKLRRCAVSDRSIGIVSPFSNDGASCALCLSFACQAESSGEMAELVNRAAELAAVPLYPDVTIPAGACMLVRRGLIRKIGVLDEALGSIADVTAELCARARRAGYRTVLCDDTYVFRRKGVDSSSEHGEAQAADRSPPLLAEQDGSMRVGRASFAPDAIRPICNMIQSQVAALKRKNEPGVLHIIHDRGGGTEKYVRELINDTRGNHRHYFLRILRDRWRLTDVLGQTPIEFDHSRRPSGAANSDLANYDYSREDGQSPDDWLASVCSWLGIGLIHVHSLVGSGDDLAHLLRTASIPYCYSVHDMYLPCPTVYLIDSRGKYCGATTDNQLCQRCLASQPGLEDIDIKRWRERYQAVLEGARMIFAPSEWARETLRKYFRGISVTVAPPSLKPLENGGKGERSGEFSLPTDRCRHIGVLGAIGPEKGARNLDQMVARIRERGLPLRLVVIGYTDRQDRYQSPDRVLTIHGPYQLSEISDLLDYYNVSIVVFPTIWPETFGYTLSETWMARRPALVPPRGALQERVIASGAGWTMDGWPSIDAMLDQIMLLTAPENRSELERRARLAVAASRSDACDLHSISRFYGDMLSRANAARQPLVSRMQIYQAASRAMGVAPLTDLASRSPAGPSKQRRGTSHIFRMFRK